MKYHQPVLLNETLDGLDINPYGIYVDVTFGGGGHSKAILQKLENGRLFSFDQDTDALAWQSSATDSYDGNSWWCAEEGVGANGGYLDSWIQFLDTPSFTVPASGVLSADMKWAIEDYAGATVAGTCNSIKLSKTFLLPIIFLIILSVSSLFGSILNVCL